MLSDSADRFNICMVNLLHHLCFCRTLGCVLSGLGDLKCFHLISLFSISCQLKIPHFYLKSIALGSVSIPEGNIDDDKLFSFSLMFLTSWMIPCYSGDLADSGLLLLPIVICIYVLAYLLFQFPLCPPNFHLVFHLS